MDEQPSAIMATLAKLEERIASLSVQIADLKSSREKALADLERDLNKEIARLAATQAMIVKAIFFVVIALAALPVARLLDLVR